jgi:serine protease Do
MVKLYGAGGIRGLEAYQSGFLISESGHIATVWSYVLDTDYITATLDDGRRFEAKLVGADPRLELAVLKIEADELAHFDLAAAVPAESGSRVLAFSNLFGVATGDEPASVQHGTIAVKTRLDARRGVFESPYRGSVYVLDAMTNNPGAAGGARVNQHGERLAMLGKELRSAPNNIWLYYALPIDELRDSVDKILSGKFTPTTDEPGLKPEEAVDLAQLGLVLVPDVLERTPPYVELVRGDSPAQRAGVKPDDLVVFVGENLVHSCKGFRDELAHIERGSKLRIVLMRDQELVEVELEPPAPENDE